MADGSIGGSSEGGVVVMMVMGWSLPFEHSFAMFGIYTDEKDAVV